MVLIESNHKTMALIEIAMYVASQMTVIKLFYSILRGIPQCI